MNSSRRSEWQLRDDSKIQAWFVLFKSFARIVMVVKIMYLKKIICISSNLTVLSQYTLLFFSFFWKLVLLHLSKKTERIFMHMFVQAFVVLIRL